MENASKALLMAAGILMGILVLSLAVFLFANFGSTSSQIRSDITSNQLTQFNTQFTIYAGRDDITIYDIISLDRYVKENNEYYEGIEVQQIKVMIATVNIAASDYSIKYENLITTYTDSNGNLKKFECLGVTLNNRGKVKQISFNVIN